MSLRGQKSKVDILPELQMICGCLRNGGTGSKVAEEVTIILTIKAMVGVGYQVQVHA